MRSDVLRILHHGTIDGRDHAHVVRIGDLVLGRDHRPHRTEARKLLAHAVEVGIAGLAESLDPVARRHIVDEGIADDMIHRLGLADIVARRAEHDGELALEIDHRPRIAAAARWARPAPMMALTFFMKPCGSYSAFAAAPCISRRWL